MVRNLAWGLLSLMLFVVGGYTLFLGFNHPPEETPTLAAEVRALPGQTPVGPTAAPLPPAVGDPVPEEGEEMTPAKMAPDHLFIPALGIYGPVNTSGDYGKIINQELVLPGPLEMTRYRGGANVVESSGNTVISGHVTSRGVRGVLYNLAKVEAGNLAYLKDAEGNLQTFQLREATAHVKEELPQEIFEPTEDRALYVITCGGKLYKSPSGGWFYDSNIVAKFVPVVSTGENEEA